MLFYRYKPLQHDNTIRLLVLHPSLNSSDPIRCTIQHAQLSDASLEYEAVSYTWGDATRTQAIYFHHGTRELHVGQNCYNALWRLRPTYRDRMLWIDAICINQNNLQERARQVRIMDKIYNYASNVLVILSEPNANSSALFDELAAADEELSLTGDCKRNPPSDSIIALLEDLFRDPWFTRVWVLQEVCAKSSVEFICGSASVSYTAFLRLYIGYSTTVVTKRYWPQVLQWMIIRPEDSSTPQFNLWNRLGYTRDYLATDPKDRIFALKSLSGARQSEMDHLIDYTQSLEECCTHVATFLLPVLGLRLLTAARHPHEKNISSWVPDWSQSLPLGWSYFVDDFPDVASAQHVPHFGTSEDQKHTIRSFVGKNHVICLELLVTGCRYAQIAEKSQVFQFGDVDDAERQMRKLYTIFSTLRHHVNPERMQDDPIVLDHLGTIILDAISSLDGDQLGIHLSRCNGWAGWEQVYSESIHHFKNSLEQCRICLTQDGELVIVPEAVKYGDVIIVLSGAISACVVRPFLDGTWSLISGDCHIFADDSVFSKVNGHFMCDEYVACNQDRVEEFRLG